MENLVIRHIIHRKALLWLLLCAMPLMAVAQTDVTESEVQRLIDEGLYYRALELLESCPDSLKSPVMLRQETRVLTSFARYEEAKALILPLATEEGSVIDKQLLAGIYESMQQPDSAITVREEIKELSPYNIVNVLRLSDLYEEKGVGFLGLTMMNNFLYEYPDNRPVRQRRAAVNYAAGYYRDAYADFDLLYHAGDRSMNTVYYHGQSLVQQDSLEQAIPVLKEAIKISEEANPFPMIDLATIYVQQKEPTESALYLAKVDSLMERTPLRIQVLKSYHDLMAETDFLRGAYRSSLRHLRDLGRLAPDLPDIPYRQSLTYRELGDATAEMKALETYLELRSDPGRKPSPRVLYARKRLEQLREDRFMGQK